MSLIRVKRSGSTGSPSALAQGEMAYSFLSGSQSNGGDRLYIGTGTESGGVAANIEVIGGKYFTSKLSHVPGTLTANAAVIVDGSGKIDTFNSTALTANTFTITGSLTANSSTGTSGQVLTSNSTGVYWSTITGSTDIGQSSNSSTISITSSTGSGTVLLAANSTKAGLLSADAQTIAGVKTFTSTISGSIDGSANNASYLGGTAASGYQTTAGLSANVATLAANSATYANGSSTNTFTVGTGSYFVANGNVGVGNSAPADKLSVNGTAYFSGNIRTAGNMQIDGDLTVSGNTVTVNVTNLAVEDNMIYLNNGSTVANPDLGIAGNYNDGTYAHAGIFRDASDGVWKFYHGYLPEPDASAYIDTANASFTLSTVQANTFIGALNGTANNATYLNNQPASYYSNASNISTGTLALARLAASTISGISLGGTLGTLTFGTGLTAGGSSYDGSSGVTITAVTATTSTKGIASFDSTNFTVTSGAVSLTAIDGGTY